MGPYAPEYHLDRKQRLDAQKAGPTVAASRNTPSRLSPAVVIGTKRKAPPIISDPSDDGHLQSSSDLAAELFGDTAITASTSTAADKDTSGEKTPELKDIQFERVAALFKTNNATRKDIIAVKASVLRRIEQMVTKHGQSHMVEEFAASCEEMFNFQV